MRIKPGSPYERPSSREASGACAGQEAIDFGARPATKSESIAERFAEEERQALAEERRAELSGRLRREIKRRRAVLEKVRADAERVARREDDRICGELLKAALGDIPRGATRVEVADYFTEGMPRIEIELDPKLSPRENVERYFKRYRKAERAVPHIERRHAALTADLDRLEAIRKKLSAASSVAEIETLEAEARPLLRARARGRTDASGGEAGAGPRRFQTRDGVEVLVGRSARDNDRLTTRIARGGDYFVHVSGATGAHVIVRLEKGRSLPQETLLDAAQLALWYSLPERARRLEGDPPSAEVDYTPVKFVRKLKGDRPGRVRLVSHRTVRVRLEPERLARLLGR